MKINNKLDSRELLTEVSLNRLVNGHDENGYAMISASRSELPEEKNNSRYRLLKASIKVLGYSYVPVYGGYNEEGAKEPSIEKSLMVFPYDIDKKEYVDYKRFEEDMIDVATSFDQDAVLLKGPDTLPRYYFTKDGTFGTPFTGVTLNDVQKEYFTSLKGLDSITTTPRRFTYIESYVDEDPSNIMGKHARSHEGELII